MKKIKCVSGDTHSCIKNCNTKQVIMFQDSYTYPNMSCTHWGVHICTTLLTDYTQPTLK